MTHNICRLVLLFLVAGCGSSREETSYEGAEGRDSLAFTSDAQYAAIKKLEDTSSLTIAQSFEGRALALLEALSEPDSGWVYRQGLGEYNRQFDFHLNELSNGQYQNQDGRTVHEVDTVRNLVTFGWPDDSIDVLCTSFEVLNKDFIRVGEWNQCQVLLAKNLYARNDYVSALGEKRAIKGRWASVTSSGDNLLVTLVKKQSALPIVEIGIPNFNASNNPYFGISGNDGIRSTYAIKPGITEMEFLFTIEIIETISAETKQPRQAARLINVEKVGE